MQVTVKKAGKFKKNGSQFEITENAGKKVSETTEIFCTFDLDYN